MKCSDPRSRDADQLVCRLDTLKVALCRRWRGGGRSIPSHDQGPLARSRAFVTCAAMVACAEVGAGRGWHLRVTSRTARARLNLITAAMPLSSLLPFPHVPSHPLRPLPTRPRSPPRNILTTVSLLFCRVCGDVKSNVTEMACTFLPASSKIHPNSPCPDSSNRSTAQLHSQHPSIR